MDINPSWNNQIIYKAAKGKIGTWRVCVSETLDGACYITASARTIGGKEVETPTHITAGKSGRTPYEQALLEAESKFKVKIRKGYTVEMPDPNAKPKNPLGLNIAVRAQKFHEVTHTPPYLVSPKLDGHHMSAGVLDGRVTLYSMNAKEINLPHIRDELQVLYNAGDWDGTELDGELYLHGKTLDEIKSLAAGNKPESKLLNFHVYDIMHHDKPYEDRLDILGTLVTVAATDVLQEVVQVKTECADYIQQLHDNWVANGFEGSMIRWNLGCPKAGYADSARSKFLLKKKDYQDAEFEVIGHAYGKPKVKNGQQFEVPILILKAPNGSEFRCTIHGDMNEKHQAHLDGLEKRYGDQYTVKYFTFTAQGIPSQPVGVRWRNDL